MSDTNKTTHQILVGNVGQSMPNPFRVLSHMVRSSHRLGAQGKHFSDLCPYCDHLRQDFPAPNTILDIRAPHTFRTSPQGKTQSHYNLLLLVLIYHIRILHTLHTYPRQTFESCLVTILRMARLNLLQDPSYTLPVTLD